MLVVVARPSVTLNRGGRQLAFVVLFLLPVLVAGEGAYQHMERSKRTAFCLSCHTMEPYGRSLYIDDPTFLPAGHFQNARIPRDQACYTCHTDYTMYGGLQAKIRGLRHVWAQYVGPVQDPIRLYSPYNNRECLYCHAGARSFEEGVVHVALIEAIRSNELSCLSSGCHSNVHDVAHLNERTFWSEPE